MKTASSPRVLRAKRKPIVLSVGFFDGFHRGHQKVVARGHALARRVRGESWVLTFRRHPADVLREGAGPPLLMSPARKRELLAQSGADGCLALDFTPGLAALSPDGFVDYLCGHIPRLTRIVVGQNWRFGHGRAGDVHALRELAGRRHIGVSVVRPVRHAGRDISSTRVRRAVLAGRVSEAAVMLGRPHAIGGRVVAGRGRGRRLGFPTANLDVCHGLLPGLGVYAGWVGIGRSLRRAVVNVGVRPTLRGQAARRPVAEVHVLDFDGRLYNRSLTVHLVRRLRPERRFSDERALAAGIRRDVKAARRCLRRPPKKI